MKKQVINWILNLILVLVIIGMLFLSVPRLAANIIDCQDAGGDYTIVPPTCTTSNEINKINVLESKIEELQLEIDLITAKIDSNEDYIYELEKKINAAWNKINELNEVD